MTDGTSSPPGSAPSDPPGSGYAAPGAFGVTAISPAPGATNVTSSTVQITFSSALDLSTVSPTTIHITGPGSSAVTGNLAYSAGSTVVTFTITTALESGAYTVTVSGVKSSAGAAMASPFTSTFATPPPPQPVAAPITNCPFGNGLGTWHMGNGVCVQYVAELLVPPSYKVSCGGSIWLNLDGNMNISFLSSADVACTFPANSDFTVQFCPAYNSSYSANVPACFDVGAVSSDSQGAVNSIFKFPRPGSWSGDFQVLSGNKVILQTGWPSGQNYGPGGGFDDILLVETLQPESTVNGTGVTNGLGTQAPLTFGALAYDDWGNLSFYLNGAPSNTYVAYDSSSRDVGCSCANQIGTFTPITNPSENSIHDPVLPGGDIFTVEPQDKTHAGWIGGFYVPQ